MTISKSQGLIRTPGSHGPLARFMGFALVAAVVGVETLADAAQHRGHGPAIDVLFLVGVLLSRRCASWSWRSPSRLRALSHSYTRMPGSTN